MSAAVAGVIKSQIGFWALAEVGARTFMYDGNALLFDAKPKSRIVRVKVELNGRDLYDITVRNKKTGAVLYEADDLYNDSLSEVVMHLAEKL